jgi:hypothetical protein
MMTELVRATAAIANQGSRTLSAHASLLSTRQAETTQLRRREEVHLWGIHDRIARLLKNMRRMWLPLVSPFESRNCILH